MKNKILICFLIFLFFILIIPIINFIQDDYGIFHKYKNMNAQNDVLPNEQKMKLDYLTKNKDKFNSFIMGVSQGQTISTSSFKEKDWYNLSFMSFTPYEYIDTLKYLEKHGVKVKRVLLLFQLSTAFNNKQSANEAKIKYFMLTGAPFLNREMPKFYVPYLLLNPFKSMKKIGSLEYEKRIMLLKDGSYYYNNNLLEPEKNEQKMKKPDDFGFHKNLSKEMLIEMKKIVDYCKNQNIDLKIFLSPDYEKMYQLYDKNDIKFLKKYLSEITDYYDFSGINEITTDDNNYTSFDHFNVKIADMIVKRIYYEDKNKAPKIKNFGVYVPKADN